MRLKEYIIKEGKHRSGIYFRPHLSCKSLDYTVNFNSNCIYDLGNVNQLDVNKLIGISYGLHHTNSARFGWNAVGKQIELWAYCYVNKKRIFVSLGKIDTEKDYNLKLTVTDSSYIFSVFSKDSMIGHTVINKSATISFGYYLFPYFGGDEVAPHLMSLTLSR